MTTRILTTVLGLGLLTTGCEAPDEVRSSAARPALAAAALSTAEATDVRRVWADAGDYASPSPDGRYISFVDWSTGDVAMRDLVAGEDTRLTDKGSWTENGSWAEDPIFSPDGGRVAYSYGNTQRSEGEWRYELRMVEVGDTEQHVLHAMTPEDRWIGAMDWSPTHGIAVEVNRSDRGSELGLIDPESGDLTVLATFGEDEAHPHDAWFSPGEDWLAYRRGDRVFLREVAGEAEVEFPVPVRQLLGWAPDGSAVLVHTSHRGETGIWALPVADGRPAGDPLLVRASLPGVVPSGRAGDRYFYGVIVDAPQLYQATVEPASGRVLAEPTPLTSPLDGRAAHPSWSPDGNSLAYTLEDLIEPGLRFMVKATHGDAVREIARGDFRTGEIRNLRWAEGGESLVFLAETDGRSPALYRIDTRSGAIRRESDAGVARAMDVLPDGDRLLLLRTDPPEGRAGAELVIRDLGSGATRTVTVLEGEREMENLAVSPDGRRAAFVHRDPATEVTTASVVDLSDGTLREVYSVPLDAHLEIRAGDLAWSADGGHLLVMRGSWEEEGSHEILSLPVEGGEPVTLMSGEGRRILALHPDGRRLAFSGGQMRTELWVLESLPKALAAARSASD